MAVALYLPEDRTGSNYFYAMEPADATAAANFTTGRFNPTFTNQITTGQFNAFLKTAPLCLPEKRNLVSLSLD